MQANLYVAALMRYEPEAVAEACRAWAEERDGWPDLDQLVATVREAERPALPGPTQGPAAWERIANAALGALPNCFLRRVEQLEPDDRQRFGRELADFAAQWELRKVAENSRPIERWASEWLGAAWAKLMGPPAEPMRRAGPMRPPMPDTSGLQRVVVEREAEVA